MKKLLIVVDFQNDFVDGSLGFEKAVELDSLIYDKIKDKKTLAFCCRMCYDIRAIKDCWGNYAL